MTTQGRIKNLITQVKDHLKLITDLPVYTERLVSAVNPIDIVVFLNDSNPWEGNEEKIRTYILSIYIRAILDHEGLVGFYESDLQDIALDILDRLEDDQIPPGITLKNRRTRCGFESREGVDRYFVELELSTKGV